MVDTLLTLIVMDKNHLSYVIPSYKKKFSETTVDEKAGPDSYCQLQTLKTIKNILLPVK